MRILWLLPFFLLACTRGPDTSRYVHLSIPAKIKGLDPIYANDIYSGVQISYAFEGLLQYHYLKRPYELIPNLADGMPVLEKDGVTYKIKIRKGVYFHDDPIFIEGNGREVTTHDVIYSWMRLADPKNAATGWWVLNGKIYGLDEWREQAVKSGKSDYDKPIPGLIPIDDHTLLVKLRKPNAQFLHMLAQVPAFVVAREVVEKYKAEVIHHPIGTGPYVLEDFQAGMRFVWKKNERYRQMPYPSEGGAVDAALLADAGQPLPRNEGIVSQVYEESQPMWLNFLAGKQDLAAIPKDFFATALPVGEMLSDELRAKNLRLHRFPQLSISHLTLNMADPLLGKNKFLRQALSLAYDPDPQIRLFYSGHALAAQGPILPGLVGYEEKFRNPYRAYDLRRAKALLAKAGYPEGKGLPPLEFISTSSTFARQVADYASTQFAKIGVKLKVSTYSWPEFQTRMASKQAQIWPLGWQLYFPDDENILQLFYSKNASPGPNESNYNNPEYDRLYEQAQNNMSDAARAKLYQKMAAILVEDCPWIWGVHNTEYFLAQPRLQNVKMHHFAMDQAKYWKITDPAGKR